MIRRAAVVIVVAAIAVLAVYWRRGPFVRVAAQSLSWAPMKAERAPIRIVHSSDGIDFLTGDGFALRRGGDAISYPGFRGFQLVGAYGGTLFAIAHLLQVKHVEAFVLFTSKDEGRTFTAFGPILAPTRGAVLEGWIIRGDEIALNFLGNGLVSEYWRWPWWGFSDASAAFLSVSVEGRSVLRSKNGGRSWRLER